MKKATYPVCYLIYLSIKLYILWEPRIKVAWNPTIEPTLVCKGPPGIVRGSSECRWPWMRNDNSYLTVLLFILFILWGPRIKVAWNPIIDPTLVCTGPPGIVRGSSECRWPWMRNDNSFLSRPKSSGTTGVRFSPHRDLVGFLWALIYLIPVGCLGGYALMSGGLWNSQIWVFLSQRVQT